MDAVKKVLNKMVKGGQADLFSIYLKGNKSRMYVADHFYAHPGRFTTDEVKEWYLHNYFKGVNPESIRIEVKQINRIK